MESPKLCSLLIFVSFSCWIANGASAIKQTVIFGHAGNIQVELNEDQRNSSQRRQTGSVVNLNLPTMRCQVTRYASSSYPGSLKATALVPTPEACMAVCWQYRPYGMCGSVNYYQASNKCLLMSGAPTSSSSVKTDSTSVCMVPITCVASSGSGSGSSGSGSGTGTGGGSTVSGTCGTGNPSAPPTINFSPPLRSRFRIVGGTEAKPHSYPWIVSLQDGGSHFCGGSLIRSNVVVTAAHCLYDPPRSLRVVVGAHNLKTSAGQSIPASRYVIHPQYDDVYTVNDIAIVILDRAVQISNEVQPICLPLSTDVIQAGDFGVVAGWGTTRESSSRLPDALQQVGVPVVPDQNCSRAYSEFRSSAMVCAGFYNGGKDSCQGDSGGPLIFRSGSNYVLKGVVSFGEGCARARLPGVYTKVSSYRQWIDTQLNSIGAL